jgi:ABC-type antimicrobial peptide transport system permease subunit
MVGNASPNATAKASAGGGIGFLGGLTLVFITLKLLGKIDWSWLWVLSPLWIPIAIVLAFIVLALAVVFVAGLVQDAKTRRARRRRKGL